MCEKIVLISPDEKLAEKARNVIAELGEKMEVYQGSLSEGVKLAKQAVENGANIIVSRGATGNLIRRNLQIPVVNIENNGFDIIQAIYKAVKYSNYIGIVGSENLLSAFERTIGIMEQIFSARIVRAVARTEKEVETEVTNLYNIGIRVFIGGNAVIEAAKRYDCKGVLIESGKEAIIEAIRQAKYILEVQLREKENTELLKSIIDFAYDGIMAVDKKGYITVFNPIAQKITGIPAQKAIGRLVDEVIENTRMRHVLKSGQAELSEIQQIGNVTIVTNRVPIVVDGEILGAVATFQELEKFQRMENQIRKKLYLKGHVAKVRFENIIGKSKPILQAKEKAMQFAEVDSTVLIQGETGTGKELFAQSIHNASLRFDKPFIAVNCAALPENLLESELFGYVEGAFTGARKGGKAGLFELAHGGTIFLDEISEMSLKLQARFLRVIQEKEVVRIGDDRVIPVDVRIIAATNKELHNQVQKGEFREDLYYRLCVLKLDIPPLRERMEDIPELVKHFIEEKSSKLCKKVKSISYGALGKLVLYDWPGNVRQLENIIERAIVLCKGEEIDTNIIMEAMDAVPDFKQEKDKSAKKSIPSEGALKQLEIEMIKKVLEETGGNKTLAAEKLGISVTTLWRRLKSYDENMKN